MASTIEYTEVSVTSFDVKRPARYGSPAGTDHYTVVVKHYTFPEGSGIYSGKTYERKETWMGACAGARHVLVNSEDYPVKEES